MSTETHAKRLLTVWKRSVSTTLKRSFTVLANQIIVSETFQAFQVLTNHISVRKTLSWKPCLVSNVLAFAELANQNPADSIYFRYFFSQFHLIIIVIKLIKFNSEIILWRRVSDAINRKCVLTDSECGRTLCSDALLTGDQESRVRCMPVQSGNSCLLHTIFSPETNSGYINISIMTYIECND